MVDDQLIASWRSRKGLAKLVLNELNDDEIKKLIHRFREVDAMKTSSLPTQER